MSGIRGDRRENIQTKQNCVTGGAFQAGSKTDQHKNDDLSQRTQQYEWPAPAKFEG